MRYADRDGNIYEEENGQSLGNREDDFYVLICKSGNLPAVGTGIF